MTSAPHEWQIFVQRARSLLHYGCITYPTQTQINILLYGNYIRSFVGAISICKFNKYFSNTSYILTSSRTRDFNWLDLSFLEFRQMIPRTNLFIFHNCKHFHFLNHNSNITFFGNKARSRNCRNLSWASLENRHYPVHNKKSLSFVKRIENLIDS